MGGGWRVTHAAHYWYDKYARYLTSRAPLKDLCEGASSLDIDGGSVGSMID